MFVRGKKLYHTIVFLFAFLALGALSAQQLSYKHYTVRDGLVQNQVHSIFEDSKGYLWLATMGGVSRFDGIEFHNLTVQDGLPFGNIINIAEDLEGNIILVATNFLCLYNGNSLETFYFPKIENRQCQSASTIYTDSQGVLHFLLFDGKILYTAGITNGKLSYQKIIGANITMSPRHIFFDNNAREYYIITNNNETYTIDANSNALKRSQIFPDSIKTYATINGKPGYIDQERNVISILNGKRVNLFKFTESLHFKEYVQIVTYHETYFVLGNNLNALFRVDGHGNVLSDSSFKNGISAIHLTPDGTLCIATESGFYRLLSQAFLNYTNESGIKPYIWSVVEDKDKNIWLASYQGFLQVYDGKKFKAMSGFRQFVKPHDNTINYYMGAIRDSQDNLWFTGAGADRNLLKWDGVRFINFPGLSKSSFLYLYDDVKRKRVIAGGNHMLAIIDAYSKPKTIPFKPGNISTSTIAITKDKNGVFWLGGRQGISLWDGDSAFTDLPNRKLPFRYGANAMVLDQRSNLWIGNNRGLFVYDYRTFRQIVGYQWKGEISSLALMQDGNILIGGFEGIAILDIDEFYKSNKEKLRYFDQYNGFLGSECAQNAICLDYKGRYWIPTNDRVMVFDPSQITQSRTPPLIYMSDLHVLNDRMEWEPWDTTHIQNSADLKYTQTNLRLYYHAINYSCPEKVRYQYFLEGYDATWSAPVSDRFATYTNLSPGHYTFHVKAIDETGLISIQEATMAIHIVPAIWQRLWFQLLTFGLLIAFLTWLSSWLLSTRRRQKQKQLQDELIISELQLKTFRNQMEPHFTFNAINTIGASIYSKEPEVAYTHLQKFSRLVRSLILSADQVSRPLSEELDFVRNYLELEYYRFSDRFSFDIHIDEQVNTMWEVPKMIVQTHVENALKHGLLPKAGAGTLKISAFLVDRDLVVEITDNGIGRIAAAINNTESTGKGLKIIREYCDFYERRFGRAIIFTTEDLTDPGGKAIGTKVRIQISIENTRHKTRSHE